MHHLQGSRRLTRKAKMHKFMSALFFAVTLHSGIACAQTDNGLLPNGYIVGNGSGSRGAARQIPLGTDLSLSGGTANVVTGTSGSSIPRLNGNNIWSGSNSLSTILSCSNGLVTNGSGQIQCGSGSASSVVYNVKDYGAVCDGTTDDAAAINSVITTAQAAGGGIIFFPAGYCVVQSTVNIPALSGGVSRITLQGTGMYSSFLVAKGTFTGTCLIDAKGQTIVQQMTFNNGGEIGVAGVSINGYCNQSTTTNGGVDDTIIDKSAFIGFGQNGNKCVYNGGTGTTSTTTVINSTFNICWYAYYSDRWNVGAIFAYNHVFGSVAGVYFGRGAGGLYGHTEGLQIIGNEIIAGRDPGGTTSLRPLEIDGVCYDCHVAQNIFDAEPIGPNTCPTLAKAVRISGSASTSFEQNWLAKGLLAIGTGATGSYGYNNQLRVVNNSFPGCGAFIQNMNGGSIVGNSFFTNGDNLNIQLLSLVDSNYFAVTANTFQNSTGLATGGTISNCTIYGNVVSYTSAYLPCVGGLNVGGGLP